jgi:hydrogenase maturation protease
MRRPGETLLVVGCGNRFAGDDDAGLELLDRLAPPRDGRTLIELPPYVLSLIDLFDRYDRLLFLDAVSSGAPPGTLHLFSIPNVSIRARGLSSLSTHGWGIDDVTALAARLGRHLPPLLVIGIEVAEVSRGAQGSPAVRTAIQFAAEHFDALVERAASVPADAVQRIDAPRFGQGVAAYLLV